jgi:hypothetical protein
MRDTLEDRWYIYSRKALQKKVEMVLASLPADTTICALESFYLPRGGKDEIWITLSSNDGDALRFRSPAKGSLIKEVRSFSIQDISTILDDLQHLGAWELPNSINPVMDGWVCALAFGDHDHVHSIQTHQPEGAHLVLIKYLVNLIPITVEKQPGNERAG